MATTAQLRAVLAVLQVGGTTGGTAPDPSVEHAELAGLLHRVISNELREVIVAAPLGETERRWSAASAVVPAMPGERGLSEQAQFDARWLRDRIATLVSRSGPDPIPALLAAAVQAVDAATALLALSRDPHGIGSQDAWQAVIDDLATAFHLVNDEHNGITQPIR
ncbi:hypothetical protein [Nocardia mexicana]|uniref:Uncharacterized protein n=1 Tax=Nocardia mexicana TaxID=279262 RepID=A0A370H0F9_9NOCA|nr:hypothetical protein [Nocardia mexicana]RDI49414.1 hypothetical protein DFR68_107542 [Nocardia mexicana]